jgi:hypothetical protein
MDATASVLLMLLRGNDPDGVKDKHRNDKEHTGTLPKTILSVWTSRPKM